MAYCNRMNRPCFCGQLCVYKPDGRMAELDNGAICLTDSEVRGMLVALMEEWRRRFSDTAVGTVRLHA